MINTGEPDIMNIFPHAKDYSQGLGQTRIGTASLIVDINGQGDFSDIQSAIYALPSTGGEIFIKDGVYTQKSKLIISKSDVILRGNSWGVKIMQSSGTYEGLIYASGKNNLLIENVYIDCSMWGLDFTNCTHSMIRNCKFSGANNGLVLTGCNYCFVENNYFDSCSGGDYSIGLINGGYNIVKHNFLISAQKMSNENSNYNIFDGNITYSGFGSALYAYNGANCIYTNNLVIGTDEYGLFLDNANNYWNVCNNRFTSVAYGVYISRANINKVLVANNVCVGCTTGAVFNSGTSTTLSNNTT